jgi:SAM-dependent methyltransferase
MGRWKRFRKLIPLGVRQRARRGWLVVGYLNNLVTPVSRMVPWSAYGRSIGGGGFEKVGERYLERFISIGGLQPHHHVLDVGCGMGRMAVPLTSYLNDGTYTGFDIVRPSIKWCRKRIASRYPNFTFDHVDIYNRHYNPRGTLKASEFHFPYPDGAFDFVFLISVFTHLLPDDMRNYLKEVARVLRSGGRCFITYTLLDDESLRLIEEGRSKLPYSYELDGYRTVELNEPETSVAYYEKDIRVLYPRLGLEINEPIHLGSWPGRAGDSHQDVVVATKQPISG